MISTIRDKLKSVGSGVINEINRIGVPSESQFNHASASIVEGASETALAGSELLDRFQNSWSSINQAAAENIAKSNTFSEMAEQLERRCVKENGAVTALIEEMKCVDSLADKISKLSLFAGELMNEFESIIRIVHAEEMRQRAVDFERRLAHEEAKLDNYRQTKLRHLETIKDELSKELLNKACQDRQLQLERYSTFEQLSHAEIDHFRQHRQLAGTPVNQCCPQKKDSVESLCLDAVDLATVVDTDQLDQFLADT